MMKLTNKQIMILAACAVMLLCALLLPLVNVMSYHWGISELPHKLSRLVSNGLARGVGYALLILIVLSPVALATAALKGNALKIIVLLPLVAALLFIVVLFLAAPPTPGLGLWLYLAAAVAAVVVAFMKEKASTL